MESDNNGMCTDEYPHRPIDEDCHKWVMDKDCEFCDMRKECYAHNGYADDK